MHIIIKNKVGNLKVDRSRIKEIRSNVLTHEGERLSGEKGERYRSKYIKDQKYTEPVKKQGAWSDLPTE